MKNRKPNSLIPPFLLLSGVLVGAALIASAQQNNPQSTGTPSAVSTPGPSATPASAAPAQATPTVKPGPSPRVTAITEGHLELDSIVSVEVEGLAEWAAAKNDTSKLVPYINGRAINGNYAEAILPTKNHLTFHLEMTPENKDVWIDLLGEPTSLRKPVAFSVGPEGVGPFDSIFDRTNRKPLTVISPVYGLIALFVVLGALLNCYGWPAARI